MSSSAVPGFLILFKARRICSSRRFSHLEPCAFVVGLKADLLNSAHFVFGLVLQDKSRGSEERVGTN